MNLRYSYLFYKPKIVLDEKLKPVIYYCSTPNKADEIREFIPCMNIKKLEKGISLIFKEHNIEKLEIFSNKNGIIYELALKKGADFIEYIRPNGSNMIKLINKKIKLKEFESCFILQADNS